MAKPVSVNEVAAVEVLSKSFMPLKTVMFGVVERQTS
jgi:hypothetical protein